MDFYRISEKRHRDGNVHIAPQFIIAPTKDLMIRGGSFYAIWDEEAGLWSKKESDIPRLIDKDLFEYRDSHNPTAYVDTMKDFSSGSWIQFNKYVDAMFDTSHQLDERVTFSNTPVDRSNYVSRKLSYPLEPGEHKAYDELISTLYDPDERAKLEWIIGSIISGDSRDIEKFIVLYGGPGSGKGTILSIIDKLFKGYTVPFNAKQLTSHNNNFSTSFFKDDPIVALQYDGDLSNIKDNTLLNSITSHEKIEVNEKYKNSYAARSNCMLIMASNSPVLITDANSGILRRLIDASPSGRRVPENRYDVLFSQIDFELSGIAHHCLEVYRSMGKHYYSRYRPFSMMLKTDVFYNFVETYYHVFAEQDGIGVSQAYAMYKTYCTETNVATILPLYKFREELKNYFHDFTNKTRVEGVQLRSWYSGFIKEKFIGMPTVSKAPPSLVLDKTESILDEILKDCPAQYASEKGTPTKSWSNNTLKLRNIDTKTEHYVQVPKNHIVIDFDLKDAEGNKSAELNIEAASMWPATYAEYSKGGSGIHLHYLYSEDIDLLARQYAEDIEIKLPVGDSAIRRRVSKCNNIPIATLSSGLPLKEVKKTVNERSVKSEKGLRDMINRNLRKEFHGHTAPSISFIKKLLDDAYESGMNYDVTDMRQKIMVFANNSTNQSDICLDTVNKMKFKSEDISDPGFTGEDNIIFFDVEVFPNLFVVVWKRPNGQKVPMVNPSAEDIGKIFKMSLVGFNCRRYDNHILYARYIGYSLSELYQLSQKIINNSKNAMFGEAYNVSYTDIYEFSTKKQSLKKWEIELGIHHMELGLPWDEPVDEKDIPRVVEYCGYDVDATEATWFSKQIAGDWAARKILAKLSGLNVNDTTQQHAVKIIFGDDKNPQSQFIYTDLSEMFPGYKFENGKSSYRGEDPSEGGYVWSKVGVWGNVGLLDIESMHPSSVELLELFGPKYTKIFSELKKARLYIKHNMINDAKRCLDGKLSEFLDDETLIKPLAQALKIFINIVYGLTMARFDSKFKDPRNKDNIVAKRGALFMIDLKNACLEKGYQLFHIKTDSVKIADITPEIIEFVMEFGNKYGYKFAYEATYDKLFLTNNAVYVARERNEDGSLGEWTSTGMPLIHPYIFKTLFSHEDLTLSDLYESHEVKVGHMVLDMNENLPEGEHNYQFVGRVGAFCPVKTGGGELLRAANDKYYAVNNTSGYRWLEAEQIEKLEKQDDIDMSYYENMAEKVRESFLNHADFDWFVSDQPYEIDNNQIIPF